MKLKTLIQAGCSFLAFVMVFLPWYVASIFGFSASTNAFGEPFVGVLTLLGSLAALAWFVISVLRQMAILKLKIPAKTEKIIDIVAGGLLVLFSLIGIIVCFAKGAGFTHPGFGAWLYIILGIGVVVLNFVKLDQTVGKAPAKKTEKKEAKKDEK